MINLMHKLLGECSWDTLIAKMCNDQIGSRCYDPMDATFYRSSLQKEILNVPNLSRFT